VLQASVSSTSKQQMHNILQVALDTSLALICTPAHLSVADAVRVRVCVRACMCASQTPELLVYLYNPKPNSPNPNL